MYLVLARKYRPQKFAEVIGQEHVTRTLGNAFATARVHHAFLFCGPRGCGKTTLARIVGKALNCTNLPSGNAEPCGECAACTSINNGSAVDYLEMDGASNRGIDAIRELTEAVRYQPAVLRKKVYVIDEVHMLTTEAFNALLKTLEEPPPHVTFVLATTEPHKLPNTILSRCQRYDFKLVPAQRLAQHLTVIFEAEKLAIEPAAVSLVVRESGGSVRDALSLCDQIISFVGAAAITEAHVAEVLGVADRSLTRSLVRALAEGDAGAALGAVESAIERGVDEVQLARAIVRYLRDLSVLQVAPDRPELVDASNEERADLVAEANQLARNRVTQMFDRMLRCCDELGKTLQPRLVLDCALIDVATIEPLIPLGDLIERLGELEARVAGRGVRTARGPTSGHVSSKSDLRITAPGHPGGAARAASPASTAPTPMSAPPVAAAPASAVPTPASASPAPPAPASAVPTPASASPAPPAPASAASTPMSAPPAAAAPASAVPTPASASPAPPASSARSSSPTAPAKPSTLKGTTPGTGVARAEASPMSTRASAPVAMSTSTSAPVAMSSASVAMSTSTSAPVAMSTSTSAPVAMSTSTSAPVAMSTSTSGPVSMQPSGPVPKPEATASGSGPTEPSTDPSDGGLAAWNGVLAELEARRRFSLLGPYQHARVLKWTADEIELGFPVELHSMGEMAADTTVVEEMRTLLRDHLARPTIKLKIRLLDANESTSSPARSILETTREKTSAERGKREAEAREHPITKHVLQTFGAQIKEIKTDV